MKIRMFFHNLVHAKSMINGADTSGCLLEIGDELRAKLQLVLLDMLSDVLFVCKKNQISVFLAGGSALGSIRHRGFIPWDDDVDLGMTREDYQRFIPAFEKELSDQYILNAPNYSSDSITRFPKILKKDSFMDTGESKDPNLCKVFLDIFIADHIPQSPFVRKVKGTYCNVLEYIARQTAFRERLDDISKQLYQSGGKAGYYIRLLIGAMFSYRKASRWNDLIDKAVQYHGKKTTEYGLTTGSKHYFGEIFPNEVFLPTKTAQFAGLDAPVMQDVHRYLTNLYGNYMQIPPPEKRQKHFVRNIRL